MEELANKTTDGDCAELANIMIDFLSVSDHLPRLEKDDNVFTVHEELPDEFIISVDDTFSALRKVKTNKSTGPDNIPAWVLKEHAHSLAAPLTSIFNCSLREGVLLTAWKSAIKHNSFTKNQAAFYFWTSGKFADDTRHDDWSHGVLFSP